jgi:hypothetical protein
MFKRLLPFRDVLWLVVVVALALGWWNDHRRHASSIDGRADAMFRLQQDFNRLSGDYGKERVKVKALEAQLRSKK